MKTLKTLIIFALILGLLTVVLAQTQSPAERFKAAQDAFDSSEYEKTLTLLASMEKDFGKNPRIESLRALTLRDLNRPKEAYESLLVYFQLTAKLNLEGNEAHQSLIELRDELKAQLERDLQSEKQRLQNERNENTEKNLSEKNGSATQNPTKEADPLEELEMWNKVKESNTALDYYLFIERFPNGRFASQARAKMNQVGDPEWNALKNSTDPLRFREYIKKYPNSPFIEQAKRRYEILAEELVAWELIKDSQNVSDFLGYAGKFPNSLFYTVAIEKASSLEWSRIQYSSSPADFSDFIKKYPNSEKKVEAQNRLYSVAWDQLGANPTTDKLQSYIRRYPNSPKIPEARQKMYSTVVYETLRFHKGGTGQGVFYYGKGMITVETDSVVYNEMKSVFNDYDKYSSPKNSFRLPCREFDLVSVGTNLYEDRNYNSAVGKVNLLLTYYTLDFYQSSKIIRQFVITRSSKVTTLAGDSPEVETYGPQMQEVKDAQAMVELIKSYCGR